jgi:methylenetetrahydrofolate dehydrogenase (NADP+)/methenyltetrahydrofolate cyclohydrolase
METQIVKGDLLQAKIFENINAEIEHIRERDNKMPGIAFIGFLNVPLGKLNISLHIRTAKSLGFKVISEIPDENITESELFSIIDRLNKNEEVHAIEVLQPLPLHLNPLSIINRIEPDKEVEGFHPVHLMETMFPNIYEKRYPMCLPTALQELFHFHKMEIRQGSEWVLILDNEFFGNPLVNMVTRTALTKAVPNDCQLTIVNKNSNGIANYCGRADYLVVVTKEPEFIKPDWLKQGVCIIDIYANLFKEVPSKNNPEKLSPVVRGGVNVESVKNIASSIIPIPGGLMSVVMAVMFRNVLIAYENSFLK